MTHILLKLFVKNYHNTDHPLVRAQIGRLAGTTGVICNLFLFISKLIAGILIGSVSTIGDGINNLSDAFSSIITLLGFKLARKSADKEHPYGHARYEYLSGVIVAVLILFIGLELAKSSVEKIFFPSPTAFSSVTFCILLLSVFVKLWMCFFYSSLSKKIDSTALRAASVDSRNDVFISSAVLTGLIIEHLTKIKADGFFGLAVALFIIFSGVSTLRETVSPLLGKGVDRELAEKIKNLILSHDRILGIHDLLVHDYGPGQLFASVHVELSSAEDPMECHEMIDHLERDVLNSLNVHLVIHYDPVPVNDTEYTHMHEILDEIVAEIHPELSIHDFRIKESSLVFDLLVPYDSDMECNTIHRLIDAELKERGLDYTTTICFDSGV